MEEHYANKIKDWLLRWEETKYQGSQGLKSILRESLVSSDKCFPDEDRDVAMKFDNTETTVTTIVVPMIGKGQ